MFVLSGLSAQSQTIRETFGSGANQFSIDFVQIGNPGNVADVTGRPNPAGSVAYTYNMGKYEINRDLVDKAKLSGLFGVQMFVFADADRNTGKKPAAGVSWYEAARFVNFLNTISGNTAAYKFDLNGDFQLWTVGDAGYNPSNLFRNSLAKYFLPSNDEWYKSAYGSPQGTWFDYPTGNDLAPTAVSGGTNSDTAVYGQDIIADVDNAGGLSAYGTMAQGGNLREWMETAWDKVNDTAHEDRTIRGGPWYNPVQNLDSSNQFGSVPDLEEARNGFRVAMVPEPSSFSLLLAGGPVLMVRRRKS